ncbi:PspC domain-containing protein [Acidisarcina polymorpha]|nr:PspC domain-containing protein [Acidisarcina polymorpha]
MAMYCKSCGNSITEGARFCSVCGAEVAPPVYGTYAPVPARPLVRPRTGRMIAGVCQGLANQYGWDVTWVRVIAVISAIFAGGLGAIAYVVFWVVTPEEPLALPPGQSYTPSS